MRKMMIAGNWKMNKNLAEGVALVKGLNEALAGKELNAEVIVCPPFTHLTEVRALIGGTSVKLGAQNMSAEVSGAFTGEISGDMLLSVGCEYVILGHSERRTIYKESNEEINAKVKKALADGLKPIFCMGETLEEREGGVTMKVAEEQIRKGLKDVTAEQMANVVVAYEPVWAIGTGKTASPEQAQEVHAFIRNLIADMFNAEVAENLTIQYGGSVKPENAKELLGMADIDGALVGGACLKADSFSGIVFAV